jgi:ABC-2 type transport system permease protein
MHPIAHAARLGLSRGWTEFRRSVISGQEMGFAVFFALVIVVVLFLQRDRTVAGTTLSLAMATLPSVVGMLTAMGGLGAAGALTLEREDGTLLRAKALPHGMIGYLIGRTLSVSLLAVVSLLIVLIPGLFVVPELAATGWSGWLTLVWVVVLGLLATLPWGAIIGSLATSPMAILGTVTIPMTILTAISGIFYPITAMAGWLQTVAQVFPVYWLGLGVRSAFLPASAAAVEIAGSWRHVETVGVLGVWALAGMLLAPPVLRRMARRQSGSAVEEYRRRALQRAV